MHATDDNRREFQLPDETATLALGAWLAGLLPKDVSPAAVIYLEGDLGAGKTTLVRGLLQKLDFRGPVKSPTFTLVEPYVISGLHLYHFDFYRFNFPEEFLDAGVDEYFANEGLCLVEWPNRAAPYLPPPDISIRLLHAGDGRHACIEAVSERGRRWLASSPALPAATSSAPARPS
ncbi:tRNA (adenosine(37)-N6)-threonylcarbamoyltransferase complex ATPase subunit type 1 TsaE [Sulfuricystis thermophila]|uniref:tRNA (adenosine(37)-N6)-threonylcarbamoyltransferase complex ATPase subunit type 1 TsaE n=1 Tax=Sulfuricystis thermophila TaxID=2496847 RepID=UPI0010357919|nr:tRNA (adenosine(37)-N6)-threonylcarbamoyltransferase complex ATPase subunit type 1 TsaE [Sulfuricystis thermophila]